MRGACPGQALMPLEGGHSVAALQIVIGGWHISITTPGTSVMDLALTTASTHTTMRCCEKSPPWACSIPQMKGSKRLIRHCGGTVNEVAIQCGHGRWETSQGMQPSSHVIPSKSGLLRAYVKVARRQNDCGVPMPILLR